jgi:hypothetical protein
MDGVKAESLGRIGEGRARNRDPPTGRGSGIRLARRCPTGEGLFDNVQAALARPRQG